MVSKNLVRALTTHAKMCNKIVQPKKMAYTSNGDASFFSEATFDYDSLDQFRQETDQFLKKRELRRQEMSYIDSLVREAWVIASRENAKLAELRRKERMQSKIQEMEQQEDAEIEKLKSELEIEADQQAQQSATPPPPQASFSTSTPDGHEKKPKSVKVYPQPARKCDIDRVPVLVKQNMKLDFPNPYKCASTTSEYCCRPYKYLRDEANLDPMNMSDLQRYDDRSHFFEYRPQWIWKRPSNLQMQRVWLRGKYEEEK